MPEATLAIDLPADSWTHAVTTAYPETVVRVVAVLPGPDVGTALAELRTDDAVAVLGAIDRSPDVESVELLWQRDDRALVQLETASPVLVELVAGAGVPVRTPFDVRDGTVVLSLTTSNDRLSALADRLEAADVSYELRAVHRDPRHEDDRLSDRQREALLAAVEAGYYARPRRATLTEVAGELDIAKATASGLLHRAEGKLVDWYLEEHAVRAPSVG